MYANTHVHVIETQREREEGQLRKDALQNVETLFLVTGMETFLISYYC